MKHSLISFKRLHSPGSLRSFERKTTRIGKYLGASNGSVVVVDATTAGKHYGFDDFCDYFQTKSARESFKGTMELVESVRFKDIGWQKVPNVDKCKLKSCSNCDNFGRVNVTNGPCKECGGNGVVEFENNLNEYSCNCKSCEGTGDFITGKKENCPRCFGSKHHKEYIPIMDSGDGFALNAQIIDVLDGTSDLEAVWIKSAKVYALRFNGGFGVAFPMSV